MDKLVLFNQTGLKKILITRTGESKLGEHIKTLTNACNIYEQLKNLDVNYVIVGLPEDVGVIANFGISGCYNTWNTSIKFLLNTQNNSLIDSKSILILGYLDFTKERETVSKLDMSKKSDLLKARTLVSEIDSHVADLIHKIVAAGKKPIIIGGGHNNAYGNIKGTSLALQTPINVVNFDAHSDFRDEEGRHSGNGFSYAYSEGFLKKYFMFGLHENYTSRHVFDKINKIKPLIYNTFESIEIREELKFKKELKRAIEHVSNKPFGIEIDCDAIQDFPSSAMTPSGFSANQARLFVSKCAKNINAIYLHICEAAPTKKNESQVGKLISYLITDFIKANEHSNNSI